MAVTTRTATIQGHLDLKAGLVTQIRRDDELVFDLRLILNEFDGKNVTIKIETQDEIKPMRVRLD